MDSLMSLIAQKNQNREGALNRLAAKYAGAGGHEFYEEPSEEAFQAARQRMDERAQKTKAKKGRR